MERHALERVVAQHVVGVGGDPAGNLQQVSRPSAQERLVVEEVSVQVGRAGQFDVAGESEAREHDRLAEQRLARQPGGARQLVEQRRHAFRTRAAESARGRAGSRTSPSASPSADSTDR